MRTQQKRAGSASSENPGQGSRLGFLVLALCVPAVMCGLFAQTGWFWEALGWAGMATVALVSLMMLYVIAAARKHKAPAPAAAEIERLNHRITALTATAEAQRGLAEAMWCEQQCKILLTKHKELNATTWPQSREAFREGKHTIEAPADRWTPAAEDLAMWLRRNLPALYTEEDIKIEPQQAPDEEDVPATCRLEYRALYWRKQMMDRYIDGIAAKLEARAADLRARFVEAGNPLTQTCTEA